jgi:Leucine-rich repeat (LRR) protein
MKTIYPTATLINENRRGAFQVAVGATSGYFAAKNSAGITRVYQAHAQKSHRIPAYGRLALWACADSADATPRGELTSLICAGNRLTTLNLAGLASLTFLDCSYNDLETLNASSLPRLKALLAMENRLVVLVVAGLSELEVLDCYGNQLTSLDLASCERLTVLDCSANRLLSLKLGNCRSLRTLCAHCNQLPELDVQGLGRSGSNAPANSPSSPAAPPVRVPS